MKKLLTLLFTLVCFTAFAEDKDNTADYMKQLSAVKSLSAEFKQVNNLKDYGEDIYTGKVYINMKEKALWDYIEPYSSWYLITNETIDHYDEINNQLIKMKAKDYKEYALLQVLMDFSQLSKSFTSEQKDNILYLKPKSDAGLAYINIVTFKFTVLSHFFHLSYLTLVMSYHSHSRFNNGHYMGRDGRCTTLCLNRHLFGRSILIDYPNKTFP